MLYDICKMSSENDSSKNDSLESNDVSKTEQNTDSSQDSEDATDAKLTKTEEAPVENNIEKPSEGAKDEVKSEEETTESKEVTAQVKENSDVKDVKTEDKDSEAPEKVKSKGKPKKEVEKDDKSENESEKDGESDKKDEVPLLDQPLEKAGKRERKNVQRFNEEFATEQKEQAKVEFFEGSGTPLGDIPRVNASISVFKNEDLKILHRILYKVVGKTTLIKKNIKKFNGYNFKKDSEDYTKKLTSIQKMEIKQMKSVCEMLDLPKTGTKEELSVRIIDFLLEPKDSGKPVDGGRPKRSAAVKANNRGKRRNLKEESSSDDEFKPNQSDGSDEKPRNKRKRKSLKKKSSEDEEASTGSDGESSDESEDGTRSKRKKPSKANNKSKAKGTPGRRGRPPASAKKTPSRGAKKSQKVTDSESDVCQDDSSSSEDEPLAKKAKSSKPPTDEEIKTFIKSILEGANLEEITMKTVCQKVYGNYPDFDLTHKKDFIKSTVRSLIST